MPIPPALSVWTDRRVLLTGCTGFKGAWLARWLSALGAEVHGLALDPPTTPSLWDQAGLAGDVPWTPLDIRDRDGLAHLVDGFAPDAILHLAAQALVGPSHADPAGTFDTNATGTLNLLEAVRRAGRPTGVLVVTTDKVYADTIDAAHRESDPLGGRDPYSASKACAELITASWRSSFFPPDALQDHGIAVATARAGNVIGPGDATPSRLVPHVLDALSRGVRPALRDPHGVRPWQHVLEPLAGYLVLGAALLPGAPDRARHATAWNLGPQADGAWPVHAVVDRLATALDVDAAPAARLGPWGRPPERRSLRLAIDQAVAHLPWKPVYDVGTALTATALGHRALATADGPDAVRALLDTEIAAYTAAAREAGAGWAAEDPHAAHDLSRLRGPRPAPRPRPGNLAPGEPGAAA